MKASYKISNLREVRREYDSIYEKLKDLRRPNLQAATKITAWVQRNFKADGGLHTDGRLKWEPLSEATKSLRRKGGGSGEPKILRDTGRLFSSFIPRATRKEGIVESRVDYADLHENGGTSMFRGKRVNIPQRKMFPTDEQGFKIVEPIYKRYIDNLDV